MVVQLCNKMIVVTWFNINQQKLTNLFCENKFKPQSTCEGKCYLTKKLKETETADNTQTKYPIKQKLTVDDILFFEEIKSTIINFTPSSFTPCIQNNQYQLKLVTGIFKPPRLI